MNSGRRETGVVAAYDVRKGYGFVRPNDVDLPDVFVHWQSLRETGIDGLQVGQPVRYVRHRLGQRWCASRVRLMVETV